MDQIGILDALIISLIGMAIVFAVLAILMGVVMLMGLVADKGHILTDKLPKFKNPFRRKKAEQDGEEQQPAEEGAALAPGSCGELVLVRTEERPLNELRFKRIERVDD